MNGTLLAAVVCVVGLLGTAACGPSPPPGDPSAASQPPAPVSASASPSDAPPKTSILGACSRLARREPPVDGAAGDGGVVRPGPPKLYTEIPPAPTELREAVQLARVDVEQFFGVKIARPYKVLVLPDRALFDEVAHEQWGVPATACWLVAAGSATSLTVMNPAAWRSEACEHDPTDAQSVRRLIAHEIVHVLHDQRNPSADLEALRPLDWLVEGAAVVGSGQLDDRWRARVSEEIRAGRVPKSLSEAFTGAARYPIVGSLVAFLDERLGRQGIVDLLSVATTDEVLDRLGMTEPELIAAWRVWVSLGGG